MQRKTKRKKVYAEKKHRNVYNGDNENGRETEDRGEKTRDWERGTERITRRRRRRRQTSGTLQSMEGISKSMKL